MNGALRYPHTTGAFLEARCVVSTTSLHLDLKRSLPILLVTSDHDSTSLPVDTSQKRADTHPSLSARRRFFVGANACMVFARGLLPRHTGSEREFVLLPPSRQAAFLPMAELGSATTTAEPRALLVIAPLRFVQHRTSTCRSHA